jgi:hypothetical protein
VVEFYEACLTACRLAVQRHRRDTGWRHLRPTSSRPAPRRPTAGNPTLASTLSHSAEPGRASAGPAGKAAGVAGVEPPPLEGHGWPASARAGSAAVAPGRSQNAERVGQETAASPAQPAFFCPDGERISNENSTLGGIHYA